MRSAVRKLGNSSGVILPKSLLEEAGVAVGDPVELSLEKGCIVLAPVKRRVRTGWAKASKSVAVASEDTLVWPEFGNAEAKTA
jgi:antitoxin MazE